MQNIIAVLPSTARLLNTVIDSLDLRVLRFASPSLWLTEKLPQWHQYHQTSQPGDPPFILELPGLGSFRLHPTRSRPYEFVLINPEIADIRIWNPDKWGTAIAGSTGQFYISFRSKFMQFHGVEGARALVAAVVDLFCTPYPDAACGWERVSRADLAADVQMSAGYSWQDLDRFVTRARWKDINTDSISLHEKVKQLLDSPPSDNKGGATYRVSGEVLAEVLQALELSDSDDRGVTRIIAKREPQTIYFGRFASPLYARLYDKGASLDRQNKGYLREVWKANGWDGDSCVWRHEWSLSGDFLRAIANLDTGEIEDLRDFERFLDSIPRLWRYLTCEWLKFTEPDSGDENRWRWQVADTWAVVQMAFASSTSIVRSHHPRQPEEGQLKAQMLGVAKTLAAKRARSDTDPYAFHSIAADLFEWIDSPTFYQELKERRQVLGLDDFSDTALSARYRSERILQGEGS